MTHRARNQTTGTGTRGGLASVITPEEIGSVAVFAMLTENEREQISRVAADVTAGQGRIRRARG